MKQNPFLLKQFMQIQQAFSNTKAKLSEVQGELATQALMHQLILDAKRIQQESQQSYINQLNEDLRALVNHVNVLDQENHFFISKLGITRAKIADPRVQLVIARVEEQNRVAGMGPCKVIPPSRLGISPTLPVMPSVIPGAVTSMLSSTPTVIPLAPPVIPLAPGVAPVMSPVMSSAPPVTSSVPPVMPSTPPVVPPAIEAATSSFLALGSPALKPPSTRFSDDDQNLLPSYLGFPFSVNHEQVIPKDPTPPEETKRVEFSLGTPKKFGDGEVKAAINGQLEVRTEENRTEPDAIAEKYLDDLVKKMSVPIDKIEHYKPSPGLCIYDFGNDSERAVQRVIRESGLRVTRFVKSQNKRGTTLFYLYLESDVNPSTYKEIFASRKYRVNAIVCSPLYHCKYCSCPLPGLDSFNQHIKTSEHKNCFKDFKPNKEEKAFEAKGEIGDLENLRQKVQASRGRSSRSPSPWRYDKRRREEDRPRDDRDREREYNRETDRFRERDFRDRDRDFRDRDRDFRDRDRDIRDRDSKKVRR
eukprot:TRINITY_DN634_c1_g1_i4.p1 TRINITY_DN634_c1_g1~~TRINITY_DN634_c1_g1_i4.p1  ORF type:complete len:530 (-),score=75.23 TRINITY_DN634_c1_g1_i4:196-1785(-)